MTADLHDSADSSLVDDTLRRAYRLFDDGVDSIGGMVPAAGVCGIDRSDLRRALNRGGRWLALDHALMLGRRIRRYNPSLATKIASAIVEPFDLDVFPRVSLTDKERADRLEAVMRSMPLGDQLVANALGVTR